MKPVRAWLGVCAAALLAGCGVEGVAGDEPGLVGVDEELATTSQALSTSVPIGSTLRTTAPLNLRTGAGTTFAIRLTIPSGATVKTVNRTAPSNGFYNVSYNGTVGWAHGNWLTLVSSPSTSTGSSTNVKFRLPLSMESGQCAGGRCSITAYFDTNRSSGYRRDWSCRTGSNAKTYDNHSGTDIGIGGFPAMDSGRVVLAAAPGRVIATHDGEFDRCTSGNCGASNYVVLQHADGRTTRYHHLKKWSVAVRVGQQVSCGQRLGLVGSSGRSTGPHLHFEHKATASAASTDPFAQAGACGGSTSSRWVSQNGWNGLPSATCQ
jgi:murein DD-endopeptidase MepM/ murein hydrolase activator NlpD